MQLDLLHSAIIKNLGLLTFGLWWQYGEGESLPYIVGTINNRLSYFILVLIFIKSIRNIKISPLQTRLRPADN